VGAGSKGKASAAKLGCYRYKNVFPSVACKVSGGGSDGFKYSGVNSCLYIMLPILKQAGQ
jgi:hypothetical protein